MLFLISDLNYINGNYILGDVIKEHKKYTVYASQIQLNYKTYHGIIKIFPDKTGMLMSINDPQKEQEVLAYYIQQIDTLERPEFVKLLIVRYVFNTIRYFCLFGYFIQSFNMAFYIWYLILMKYSYFKYLCLLLFDFAFFISLLFSKRYMRRI